MLNMHKSPRYADVCGALTQDVWSILLINNGKADGTALYIAGVVAEALDLDVEGSAILRRIAYAFAEVGARVYVQRHDHDFRRCWPLLMFPGRFPITANASDLTTLAGRMGFAPPNQGYRPNSICMLHAADAPNPENAVNWTGYHAGVANAGHRDGMPWILGEVKEIVTDWLTGLADPAGWHQRAINIALSAYDSYNRGNVNKFPYNLKKSSEYSLQVSKLTQLLLGGEAAGWMLFVGPDSLEHNYYWLERGKTRLDPCGNALKAASVTVPAEGVHCPWMPDFTGRIKRLIEQLEHNKERINPYPGKR